MKSSFAFIVALAICLAVIIAQLLANLFHVVPTSIPS